MISSRSISISDTSIQPSVYKPVALPIRLWLSPTFLEEFHDINMKTFWGMKKKVSNFCESRRLISLLKVNNAVQTLGQKEH